MGRLFTGLLLISLTASCGPGSVGRPRVAAPDKGELTRLFWRPGLSGVLPLTKAVRCRQNRFAVVVAKTVHRRLLLDLLLLVPRQVDGHHAGWRVIGRHGLPTTGDAYPARRLRPTAKLVLSDIDRDGVAEAIVRYRYAKAAGDKTIAAAHLTIFNVDGDAPTLSLATGISPKAGDDVLELAGDAKAPQLMIRDGGKTRRFRWNAESDRFHASETR
jgi:hypothetical protein